MSIIAIFCEIFVQATLVAAVAICLYRSEMMLAGLLTFILSCHVLQVVFCFRFKETWQHILTLLVEACIAAYAFARCVYFVGAAMLIGVLIHFLQILGVPLPFGDILCPWRKQRSD